MLVLALSLLAERECLYPGQTVFDVSDLRIFGCRGGLDQFPLLLRRLTATGVRTLTCRPPTLEELFLRHYAGRSHDEERVRVTPAP